MAEKKFEEALSRLEGIVSKLEGGDLDLEQSLRLFEEGIRLSHFCNKKLDEAERKVEVLIKNSESVLKRHPFEPEEETEETS
ncbi:MAG: exodeoxyribonuclease VII small subunit [Proteobacteria bacterium]|nr:exodeoxyribonuclease VII small subunit [Pseudomonadota bacterium]